MVGHNFVLRVVEVSVTAVGCWAFRRVWRLYSCKIAALQHFGNTFVAAHNEH
jgi:hypothetical protein